MKSAATLCFAACAALLSTAAGASGDGMRYDRFASRGQPDFSLAQFQAGQLGVIQSGYQRVYLYTAWRAIALGADGLTTAPNPAGGILRATGRNYSGWDNYKESKGIRHAWKAAAAQALHQAVEEQSVQAWTDCPRESYVFATQTLSILAQRADATPQRLQAWVDAQDRVFTFCGERPRAHLKDGLPPLPALTDLPASEGVWAQLRGYQVAAALFYKGDLAESAGRFSAIGATAGHPMRQWGAYLALRASMREAARDLKFNYPDQTERAAELSAEAQRILADPSLASLHEPTRAGVRAMQTRLTPAARFERLSKALADPRANPYLDDYLGDWRILADRALDRYRPERGALQSKNHDFIDWIVTLQSCGFPDGADCVAQRDHARARWEAQDAAGDRVGARTWLVAALMLAKTLPASMEKAALAVGPTSPEYATVRYNLARTYRLAGQGGKARKIADAMLAMPAASAGVRNLFLQERFAQATSNADAARFVLRQPIREIDPDTGESRAPDERAVPASDGLRWLNSSLTVADLLELARDRTLGAPLRNAIAAMAWLRADLLGAQDAALAAASLLDPVSPEFAAASHAYRNAQTAQARRHALVLAALRFRMTTALEPYGRNLTEPFVAVPSNEAVASNWCKAASGSSTIDPLRDPEHPPALPATSTDPAGLAREIDALEALPTATGFIGRHVMQHATLAPDDTDLPWLLYAVVQSTRGGCLDPDAHAMSKSAFVLLHSRFADSEWARKTPYYY
jgi:hypothetical protein